MQGERLEKRKKKNGKLKSRRNEIIQCGTFFPLVKRMIASCGQLTDYPPATTRTGVMHYLCKMNEVYEV